MHENIAPAAGHPLNDDSRLPEIALNSLDDAVLICGIESPHPVVFSNSALSRIRGLRRRFTQSPFPGSGSSSPFPGPVSGPSFTRLFAGPPEGHTWDAVFAELKASSNPVLYRLMLRPGDRSETRPIPVEARLTGVTDADGRKTRFIAVLHDLRARLYAEKERKEIEKNLDCVIAELSNRALHDSLTGLPNRFYFMQKIRSTLDAADKAGHKVGVALIDLNDFKQVNDTLGHAAGDALLVRIVEGLGKLLRPGEYLVRWGGDEFLWVFPRLADHAELTGRFAEFLSVIAEQGRVEKQAFGVTGSIGHAIYPDDGRVVEDLILLADHEMYLAKDSGKNLPDAAGPVRTPGVAPSVILRRILSAVDESSIGAVYAPVVELATGRVRAFACAPLWRDAVLGEVCAETFMPYAERSRLIVPLGYALMEVAMRELGEALRARSDLRIGFSLGRSQLLDASFGERLRELCLRHGVPFSSVTLKVSERKPFLNRDDCRLRIESMIADGFRFGLDKFGSGLMSMDAFIRLRIAQLDIDTTLVLNDGNPRRDWLLGCIVNIASEQAIDLVACGIDTEDRARLMSRRGVALGRGPLYGESLRADEALARLRRDDG